MPNAEEPKLSKGDKVLHGIEVLASLKKSHKISYKISYSITWDKHVIQVMGKKFTHTDLLELLIEAITYIAKAEGMWDDVLKKMDETQL